MLRTRMVLGGPRPSQTLLILTLTLALGACSSARRSSASNDGVPSFTVRVRNNLTPGTSVTVRIFAGSGTRTVLGTVSPGRTRSLSFRETLFEPSYRLTAEASDGRNISSRRFNAEANMLVEWNLRINTLDFTYR